MTLGWWGLTPSLSHFGGSTPTPCALALPSGKARRLKQAKEEAQMEVEQYRREREQEFQSKQQAVSCRGLGGSGRSRGAWGQGCAGDSLGT